MKGFHIQSTTVGGTEVGCLLSPRANDNDHYQVSIDMGKGKGKGFSRIAKLVTASARDQQASPHQVNDALSLTMMMVIIQVFIQVDPIGKRWANLSEAMRTVREVVAASDAAFTVVQSISF